MFGNTFMGGNFAEWNPNDPTSGLLLKEPEYIKQERFKAQIKNEIKQELREKNIYLEKTKLEALDIKIRNQDKNMSFDINKRFKLFREIQKELRLSCGIKGHRNEYNGCVYCGLTAEQQRQEKDQEKPKEKDQEKPKKLSRFKRLKAFFTWKKKSKETERKIEPKVPEFQPESTQEKKTFKQKFLKFFRFKNSPLSFKIKEIFIKREKGF